MVTRSTPGVDAAGAAALAPLLLDVVLEVGGDVGDELLSDEEEVG